MPVRIKKVDGYRVSTPGGVKAKRTTKAKAEAQRRLLYAVEGGYEPTGGKGPMKKKRRHGSAEFGSFMDKRRKL